MSTLPMGQDGSDLSLITSSHFNFRLYCNATNHLNVLNVLKIKSYCSLSHSSSSPAGPFQLS